jgi:hypothetical protein
MVLITDDRGRYMILEYLDGQFVIKPEGSGMKASVSSVYCGPAP